MADDFLNDIYIPKGLPDKLRKKLEEQNKILQAKRNLIDQEFEYN